MGDGREHGTIIQTRSGLSIITGFDGTGFINCVYEFHYQLILIRIRSDEVSHSIQTTSKRFRENCKFS